MRILMAALSFVLFFGCPAWASLSRDHEDYFSKRKDGFNIEYSLVTKASLLGVYYIGKPGYVVADNLGSIVYDSVKGACAGGVYGAVCANLKSLTIKVITDLALKHMQDPYTLIGAYASAQMAEGVRAYKENYKLYKGYRANPQALADADAELFRSNQVLVDMLGESKKLYLAAREAKGTWFTSGEVQDVADMVGDVLGKNSLGVKYSKMSIGVDLLIANIRAKYPLTAYEPYADYLQKLDAAREYNLGQEASAVLDADASADPEARPAVSSASQTIIAVVDCSGSMKGTDPGNLRRAALDMMIESLGPEVSLGIIAFESDATVLAEPVALGEYGSSTREKLLRATKKVHGQGGTAILEGLNLAASRCGGGTSTTCILLTDGRDSGWHGESGNLPSGAVVHTIALSDKADRTGLARLSAATGGVSEVARTNGDLQRIFGSLFARTVGDEVLALEEGTITTGETRSYDVRVEPGQGVLEGRLSWPGSDVDLSLVSPSGRVHDIFDAVRGGYGTERGTYDIIRIKSPEPGVWKAVAKGIQLAAGGEPFTLQAVARESSLRTSWALNVPVPEVGENVVLSLDTQGAAVRWHEAESWLWGPDGTQAHDRQLLGGVESLLSGSRGRRVWSMRMTAPGVYRLKVRVAGDSGGSEVARMHDMTFRVVVRGDGVKRTKKIDPFIRRMQ